MEIEIKATLEYRAGDNYEYFITSEEIGHLTCEINGQGQSESEAICDFENNCTHFFVDVIRLLKLPEEEIYITTNLS